MSIPPSSWLPRSGVIPARVGSRFKRTTLTSPVAVLTSTSAIWTEKTWTSNDGPWPSRVGGAVSRVVRRPT